MEWQAIPNPLHILKLSYIAVFMQQLKKDMPDIIYSSSVLVCPCNTGALHLCYELQSNVHNNSLSHYTTRTCQMTQLDYIWLHMTINTPYHLICTNHLSHPSGWESHCHPTLYDLPPAIELSISHMMWSYNNLGPAGIPMYY